MHNDLCPCSLDPSASNLPPIEAGESRSSDGILVLRPLDLLVGRGKDDLDVARVSLVGVDATVRTVCAAAGFLVRSKYIVMRLCFVYGRVKRDVREPAGRQCS